jgi:hypothetical protein
MFRERGTPNLTFARGNRNYPKKEIDNNENASSQHVYFIKKKC